MTNQPKLFLLPLALVAIVASAQQDAHVHGEAQLAIAVNGNELHIEFESPGANLVGFEHVPQNQKQEQALAVASGELAAPNQLLQFEGTECQLQSAEVKPPHTDAGQHHAHHTGHTDHSDAHEIHSTHASFRAAYHYRCDNVAALDTINVVLFSRFREIHTINAQWLTATKQGATTLTAKSPKLQMK
ncbi:DUF2796 domain-containing protein [Microbulbifer sp. HZ11]|uniref:DUF2796 domain-containing protein n=1 Tax=Microbulbifer sp. HZ11 TaxID=1453501 RepID=UPI0018CC3740|nr:DUF2796 domain-containing protein [Microbulbifer sp. HZ11]